MISYCHLIYTSLIDLIGKDPDAGRDLRAGGEGDDRG